MSLSLVMIGLPRIYLGLYDVTDSALIRVGNCCNFNFGNAAYLGTCKLPYRQQAYLLLLKRVCI